MANLDLYGLCLIVVGKVTCENAISAVKKAL